MGAEKADRQDEDGRESGAPSRRRAAASCLTSLFDQSLVTNWSGCLTSLFDQSLVTNWSGCLTSLFDKSLVTNQSGCLTGLFDQSLVTNQSVCLTSLFDRRKPLMLKGRERGKSTTLQINTRGKRKRLKERGPWKGQGR